MLKIFKNIGIRKLILEINQILEINKLQLIRFFNVLLRKLCVLGSM